MSASKGQVIIIAATARNGVIGRDNQLPWRLKADLARFKETTIGHPVLMGRKTWESLRRPLPARRNLVVTHDRSYSAAGAEVFPDPEAALEVARDETVFVIGGAELYRRLLDRADALLITEVHADVAGDAHFPAFDRGDFDEVRRERHDADAHNEFSFDFVEYRRKAR
ncbi:dihydrofolate reductase [Azoarcus sp. PA01]|nr:dihydrofolate reductase [Azoarcus sp. PA01]